MLLGNQDVGSKEAEAQLQQWPLEATDVSARCKSEALFICLTFDAHESFLPSQIKQQLFLLSGIVDLFVFLEFSASPMTKSFFFNQLS